MKVRSSTYMTAQDRASGAMPLESVVIQPDDEYHLHYFLEGSGFFRINEEKHVLKDQGLILTHPADNYCILLPQASGSLKYYRVVASLEPGDDGLARLIRGAAARLDCSRTPRNLRFFFEDIDQCCRINSDLSMLAAAHHAAGLLYALLDSQKSSHTTARSFAYVDRAIAFMRERIRQEIALADICAELHITEAYFIRVFKAHMGIAPMKYLMRLKIDAAAGLLLETNLPVHEVGEMLNFNSDAHFSRTFKQHMDINPLSYRNSHVRQLRSEKEKSEKDLANAYRFLETLIDATPDLIFFKSTDSIIMGCNESFCRMVGLAKDQIVGRSDFEIFPREMAEFFLAKDKVIYQQNRPFKNEEWLDFPSGERKKYEVYKAPFRDAQGKVLGLFGISRDITDREIAIQKLGQTMAEEESGNRQKSDFLLTMSEEIIGSIEEIRSQLPQRRPDDDSAQFVDSSALKLEYLAVLAEEIIAFTRFESAGYEPDVKRFNLIGMFRRLENSLYSRYSSFNVGLSLRTDPGVPEAVFGDEQRLYHVLVQLINSSIKYSQQGMIDIAISYADPKAFIVINLSRAHFSEERISAISAMQKSLPLEQAFFLKGVDLSLTMAKRLLKMLNGTLEVRTALRNRVAFEIFVVLPAAPE